jgi:hypothetical protein
MGGLTPLRGVTICHSSIHGEPDTHKGQDHSNRGSGASKKEMLVPPLHATLLAPDPEDPTSTTLELDELWSFVLKKAHDSWIWIAFCRKTRQLVAYALGDRSQQDVSTLVGSHSSSLPPGTLRNVLLGGIQGGDPRGATYGWRKRDRRNLPRRALE